MKLRVFFSLSLSAFLLAGCNGIGPKDELVARVGSENIYQYDLDFVASKNADWDRSPNYASVVRMMVSQTALASYTLSKYPDLAERWNEKLSQEEAKNLTIVFQRYFSMVNLMNSEERLRTYFETHRDEFKGDTLKGFLEWRGEVAKRLFLEDHADSLTRFKLAQAGSHLDSLNMLENFINGFKRTWVNGLGTELAQKYKIEVKKIEPPEAEKYFEAHRSDFMTVPAMELYHIQMADSAALARLVDSKTFGLDEFKALAMKASENEQTHAQGGFIGKVKKDYAMPYGIGMVNGLFDAMDGKPAGSVSPVMPAFAARGAAPVYHVFYMTAQYPAEQKPFDRAKPAVLQLLEQGNFTLDSDAVLATVDGTPLVRERDVLAIYAENPSMTPSGKLRERIVSTLVDREAFAREARVYKLNKSWEFKALMSEARRSFLVSQYEKKYYEQLGISEDSVKAVYAKYGDPISVNHVPFNYAKEDILDYLTFPENLLKQHYFYSFDRFGNRPVEEGKARLIGEKIDQVRKYRRDRFIADAWEKCQYAPYRDILNFDIHERTPEALFRASDSLYKAKKLELAISQLKRYRLMYPENDSLFAWATFQIAQMESESDEDYDLSQAEYHAFYGMNPDHPDAEKAMFSRGFLLNENLQRDAEALTVLEEFQQKYPKSELKESVDWLVENIKSNGKLADDLLKKISEE